MTKINIANYYTLWLRPNHLPNQGRKATITEVSVEELHPTPTKTKQAIVLSFKETNKNLALNQTQINALVDLFGEDTDTWEGQTIMLTPKALNKQQNTIVISSLQAKSQGMG